MITLQDRLAEVFPPPRRRGLNAEIAALCKVAPPSVHAWFSNPEKVRSITRNHAELICSRYQPEISPAWLADGTLPKLRQTQGSYAPSPSAAPSLAKETDADNYADHTILQYQAFGGMNNGFMLEDHPPGVIKSWKVDRQWLRLNVPVFSSVENLCIVTGFGPSMKPRYNPGDPLLCDRGVTTVDTDGVYFFRVGEHGFIKQLQRIPTDDGLILRAKSFNKDYDPFDISERMDFEVFGKILMAWRSEQF